MPRESRENKTKRASQIVKLLKKLYPHAKCSLDFKTPHQLMVATILSAQCTDERVNKVTPDLFRKYKSIEDYARADHEEFGRDIYSAGFYNSKTKSIVGSAQQLLSDYNGEIPRTLKELIKLKGVGRKTGSVILGVGFGLAEGIVVDTHVSRISKLLGLTNQKTPEKIETDLMKLIPKKDWIVLSHLLIYHGRAVCVARRPDCENCSLRKYCPEGQKLLRQ